ncbi:PAS domain-containing hybrid sensor histidine kinase/response regulator [Algoriphagus antarcticus]|uniref:histidine kinase n=1 Tax=Algoriphagus antarcticus TaxID=238540 RepID=A0A3E0DXP4_9BACT|nr:ATP-binding protein [Algoriphagus antarcticus]REG88650.1 PAS domain S-box-containing protein [Algoriphagus antarcticus]
MNQFSQFDISDVFDEINAPLFVLDSEEIIFFNKFFVANFVPISDSWRDVFKDNELVKSLNNFFETGEVPKNAVLDSLVPKVFDNQQYEWSFTNLPSDYSVRFLIVRAHEMKFLSEKFMKDHKTKEDLLKSEVKYRTLVEESTEIIFSLSDKLVLNYISPNVKQFLGYDSEQVIGTSILDYLNPEDFDVFQSMHGDVSDFLAENQYLEYRLKHKNGEYRVVSSNGRMVVERETNMRYYTGIARDITVLKQAQKDLFKAKERAEQASMAKSQFLSIMSHEIRTPMNAVIGLAHFLMEDNPRADQLENLRTLQFSAENLMALINDILDFNKIDAGKIELENVPFNLKVLVNRIVHSYSFQAKEKALKISTEIDGEIPQNLLGDSIRIGQIVNNLLSNSIKFTNKGQVKTSLQLVNREGNECEINFRIEDSGIGISEEKMVSIFEAFTQASTSTTRKFGGTGLGLAIVKRLVELHGSKVKVSSTLSVGTIFEFSLKFICVEENIFSNTHQLEFKRKSLQDASILVAEDNLVNQILIKKFLKKWQVSNLVIASDGQEAIDQFELGDFDIILLDIQMPVLDGFAVAKWIRGNKDLNKSKVPILVLSATSYHEIKDEMEKIGIDAFVEKPFTPEGLYGKLTEYLNPKDLS